MLCPNCGATLPNQTKFCAFCGASQIVAKPMVQPVPERRLPSSAVSKNSLSLHTLISAILAVCGAAFGFYLFLVSLDDLSHLLATENLIDYVVFGILLTIIAGTFAILLSISVPLLLCRRKVGVTLAAISHLLFGVCFLLHRLSLLSLYWRNWMGNPLENPMFLAYLWPLFPAILLIAIGIEELIRSKKIKMSMN